MNLNLENRLYEKCAHCHLFIEVNDDAAEDHELASYDHMHRGDVADEALISTHDASPSGDVRMLHEWMRTGPDEMRARFID